MIRIIKGTYGRLVNGRVEAMTASSDPFSLSEEREAELIAAGVAEKVETPAQAESTSYDSMSMAELRKAAAAEGVDAGTARSKKDLIAALEAADKAKAKAAPGTGAGEE